MTRASRRGREREIHARTTTPQPIVEARREERFSPDFASSRASTPARALCEDEIGAPAISVPAAKMRAGRRRPRASG